MGAILDAVASYLDGEGWSFTRLPEQSILRFEMGARHGEWVCYARTWEEDAQLVIYSAWPEDVPEDRRLAMAEFLTRANFGLVIGNFELDLDDGELHFKTSIDVEGDRISAALIRQLIDANVAAFDHYWPGVAAVQRDGAAPEEAIARVEEGAEG